MAPRPEIGEPVAFALPAEYTFTLHNGLRATLAQLGDVPRVAVRVVVRAGQVNEPPDQAWIGELAAQLMQEGAGDRDAEALADAFAQLGGQLYADVGDETTAVRTRVLSEHGPAAVGLLADVLRRPTLPESEVPRLKADLRRRLSLARAEPSVLTRVAFRSALYGEHPFGRDLPTDAMVDAFTREAAHQFLSENLGAARTRIYVAGRFDQAAMEQAIREAFEDWEPGPAPVLSPPRASSRRLIHLVNRPGAEQSTIYLGLPVPDPSHDDAVRLAVMDALLGGAFSSRITRNIREDKGYTYSPRSAIAAHYRDAHWVQTADVTTNVTGASLHEIFGEIAGLQAEAPSEEEVAGSKNYVTGTYTLRFATLGGMLDQFAALDLHELGREWAETYPARVTAVTPEDVQRMAQEYLRADEMAIAIAGDAEVIREQIAPYGEIIEAGGEA